MTSDRFVLRPRPPVRAFGLSGVIDLLAGVLIVVGAALSSLPLVVVGAVLAVLGLGLLLAALVGRARLTTTVDVDDRQISIRSRGRTAGARWNEINQVSAQEHVVYLWTDRDSGDTLQIFCPRGAADPEVARMTETLAHLLDADRGYRTLN